MDERKPKTNSNNYNSCVYLNRFNLRTFNKKKMVKDETRKQLITLMKKTRAEAAGLKIKLQEVNREYSNKTKAIDRIQQKIEELESDKTVRISEHALLRYFERVKGYDLEQIQQNILSNELKQIVETLGGSGTYPFENNKLIMKEYTIVTII